MNSVSTLARLWLAAVCAALLSATASAASSPHRNLVIPKDPEKERNSYTQTAISFRCKDTSMPARKMLILRGNSAPAGTYPDEQGRKIAWPRGALHVSAASEFARLSGYEPVVLREPGQPQSESSPQATKAVNMFLEDQAVTAFYGFSGGGYNLRYILHHLASNHPETLHRIDLVVVLGVKDKIQPKFEYESPKYNAIAKSAIAKRKMYPAKWEPAKWDVVYKGSDPPKSALPKDVPKDTSTHMFGPDALLKEMSAGRCRD
jgi:hypothetical protein